MFSVRLITADSYQAMPLSILDPTYSEFRGAEIKNVPIVRVFGTALSGEKTCLHLHGAFPYMYVPFTGEYHADSFPYKLAVSLDAAINVSLGAAMSNTHHVYRIERVAGIPFYGYHKREHQFLKVFFYNPAMMKRATDLLQNGSVLNIRLQPHEAHVPYILQFMIDYNLHGMSFINLSNVKFRCVSHGLSKTEPFDDSVISPMQIFDYLPSSISRQSVCQFEVDALVSDIQNRQELVSGIELNPGLATIWREERARRVQAGLSADDSQLVNPVSPSRLPYQGTESDIHQQQRLNRRLQQISQFDERTISTNSVPTPYPLETNDEDQLIHASNLERSSRNNTDESQKNFIGVDNSMSINISQISEGVLTQNSNNSLNLEDLKLVEMLVDLAHDSGDPESIDDNSVLGTQSSMLDEAAENNGIEDEDDVVDLNITCSELDQITFCDDIDESPSQLMPVNISQVNTNVLETSRDGNTSRDTNYNSHGSAEILLPQFDGVGDEWDFIESDKDEGVTAHEELKRVNECRTSTFNNNSLANGDDGGFIAEELMPSCGKSDRHDMSIMACIDDTGLASVSDGKNLAQFNRMNYETWGLMFQSNYHYIKQQSLSRMHKMKVSLDIGTDTFFDTTSRCVTGCPMGSSNTDNAWMIKVKLVVGEFPKLIYITMTSESASADDIKSNMLISNKQSSANKSKNCVSFVVYSSEFCQNCCRQWRFYTTTTDHPNNPPTVGINEKMISIKSTIGQQQLWIKSLESEYLGKIVMRLFKLPRLDWSSRQIIVDLVGFRQPYTELQRLTSSVSLNKHTIPALDGPADLSSSDSDAESDAEHTDIDLEKRACIYRSSQKKMSHEMVITPKKRKLSHSDEDKKIGKRNCAKCCAIQQSSDTFKKTPCSMHKCIGRTFGISTNYSPLKIMVTSPTVCRVTHDFPDTSHSGIPTLIASTDSVCTTPNRRKQSLNGDSSQSEIVLPATDEKRDISNIEMHIQQQCMDTRDNHPGIQRPAVLSRRLWRSEDIPSNVRTAINIRKSLFLSTNNSSAGELMPAQYDARINKHDDSIKSAILLDGSETTKPYCNPEEKNDSDIVTTMLTQSNEEIRQNNFISTHTGELHTEENNLCNETFTEYVESHKPKLSLLPCSIRIEILSKPGQSLCIVPRLYPPPIRRIIDTLKIYDIPEFEHLQPFFSNHDDASGQKEIVHKLLNVPGKSVMYLSIFKSIMDNITGLDCWRRMKINEFHLGPGNSRFGGKYESKSLRQSLAGNASVVIVPLMSAPLPKNVMKWFRSRKYYETVQQKIEDVITLPNRMKKSGECIDLAGNTLKIGSSVAFDSNIEGGSLEKTTAPSWAKLGQSPNVCKEDAANVQAGTVNRDIVGGSATVPKSNEGATSLESILTKSTLFKKTAQSEKFGISCGQIDCLPDTIRSNVVRGNMQNCRALARYQFLTILCVEVHVNTRHDLLPNPQYDQISALFYAIHNDVPSTSSLMPLKHGVISICTNDETKSDYWYGSEIPFVITCVADEKELFNTFMDIVICSDAEILIGWEIESLSWGYIFQRASRLGMNLIKGMSRVPMSQWKRDNETSDNLHSLADMKLPGRIVLDIWRIMKSEVALLTYTFENVMYHVMNERLPCPSFKSLTTWWQSIPTRWRVVQHYSRMVLGILRILEQLDIIGRTSEFARLFGIQFYEVFSRGSQYRVESLMLRLAKPLNYVAISPSPQQRSSMRAMEALPLIMEPESMFYSDPVVVLDFQSLYPSIIIAHNYCFSTCLGRVEHIGQPDPFEFGASVLRVPKHMALKLRGKVNFAPCGVAFVKPEVRIGILPRMLREILNTRLMVKKAMKDHSQDDKLLQRVLHSRQKGLKDLANVTYGYTAANFTGRMPCIEVGDSVVSKAKETLERAIKLVESTPQWGARVIYGDTDSLFILVPGKSKCDAFNIGHEIADAVTASNLAPIKLKFEKILYPAILQSKKRYCGYMYETLDQNQPKFLAKGIETVRRDGCPAVSKILEKSLRILFDTKDVSLLKQYVTRQLNKVFSGKVSLEDLTFAKEFRGINGYKESACVPALELTRRMLKKDPRALPRRNERVRYVIVAGAPNQALIHCVKSPWELINDPGLRLNAVYYVTRVIIPPLNRCLSLMGVDVNMWYKEMTHRQMIHNPVAIPEHKQKQTISQYFGTVICVSCSRTSNKGICNDCLRYPTETLVVLHEKWRWLERMNDHITTICQSCVGSCHIVDCVSLDCPVLYRRYQVQKDVTQGIILQRIIQAGDTFDF